MRACQPVLDGYVERQGVKVHYEVFGAGEPTVMLLPTWSIIHARHWKLQVPDLARRHQVVAFDGRAGPSSINTTGATTTRTSSSSALPRRLPAGPLPRGPADGLRRHRPRRHRPGDRGRDRPPGRRPA